MDAASVFRASTGVVAGVVVDGIGNDPDGADTMWMLAQVAARIGATDGPLAGILTANALISDPGIYEYKPSAVAVLAVVDAKPAEPVSLAWVGDSHAYSWDGTTLTRRTTPHTMGEFLRWNDDEALAPRHDNWVQVCLGRNALPTTVARTEIPAGQLVLLVSDGVDCVPHDELESLVRRYQHEPQELADLIVTAVREDEDGYRDDATAVVLMPAAEPA